MQVSLDPRIALPIAALALATSFGIWYYLLRSVPQLHQFGIVQSVEFKAKETVEKTELRNLRNADNLVKRSRYTLPNRFIYTIKLNDGKVTRYQENAPHLKAKPNYAKGDKLNVSYEVRDLPFGESKISVHSVESK